MLTKQDLKQIENIVDNRLERFSAELLMPVFEQVATKEWTKEWCLENLATKEWTKEELKHLELKMMDEFDYQRKWMNERFEHLTGIIISGQEKFSTLVHILHEEKGLSRAHLKRIAQAV